MAQKPKIKRTHRYTEEQQQQFMAYAREHGDSNDTTKAMERKFLIPQRVAYYYRRKAFGYRNDQRLPVRIQVKAEVVDLLKLFNQLVGEKDYSGGIFHLFLFFPVKEYKGKDEGAAIELINLRNAMIEDNSNK